MKMKMKMVMKKLKIIHVLICTFSHLQVTSKRNAALIS